jgi:hypothetical protein
MLIDCPKIKAIFPSAGFSLFNPEPIRMLWDCHHGGTFVLRVADLAVAAIPQETTRSAIIIELSLSPPEQFIAKVEGLAAVQHLNLSLFATLPADLTEKPTLSAAHVPEAKLFIFSEESLLTARPTGPSNCELAVTGSFKARQVPCQETDLLIHLEKEASTRLLSYLVSLARKNI